MRSDRRADIRAARFAADRPRLKRPPTAAERMARIRAAGPNGLRAEAERLIQAADAADAQAKAWPAVAGIRLGEALELRRQASRCEAEADEREARICQSCGEEYDDGITEQGICRSCEQIERDWT